MTDYLKHHNPCGHFHKKYVAVVTPPEEPVTPSGGYTVYINGSLMSNVSQGEAGSYAGPFTCNIPAGTYKITLSSYDDHVSHPGQTQPAENFFCTLRDIDGNVLATTGTISDIPDTSQTGVTEVVNQSLTVAKPVRSIMAYHGLWPSLPQSNPNSVTAVYIKFDPVEGGEDDDDDPVDPAPIPPVTTTGVLSHKLTLTMYSGEIFSILPIGSGYLLGDYGLTRGGAKIINWDGGGNVSIALQPSPAVESFMDLHLPSDGNPVTCTEHYGSIYKRTGGTWTRVYTKGVQNVLMFYIRELGGILYCNWYAYGTNNSGLMRSTNNGSNWSEIATYSRRMFGMNHDGSTLYIAGDTSGYPVLINSSGTVICSNGAKPGWTWWGVACGGGKICLGSYYYSYQVGGTGFINTWNGSSLSTFNTQQPYVHALEYVSGNFYAVATNAWDRDGMSTLYRSPDGLAWTVVANIPCGHIINMHPVNDGLLLVGGKYASFGKVFKYTFPS